MAINEYDSEAFFRNMQRCPAVKRDCPARANGINFRRFFRRLRG